MLKQRWYKKVNKCGTKFVGSASNILKANVTLSIILSRFYCRTDFDEVEYNDRLELGEGEKRKNGLYNTYLKNLEGVEILERGTSSFSQITTEPNVMKVIGTVYEDVTSDVLGNIGTWQWLVTFVSAALMVPAMFNHHEDMFLLHSSEEFCISPSDFEVLNSSLCFVTVKNNETERVKCDKWTLKLFWVIWLRKTWLVFCDDKLKLFSTAIISRFGSFFGCIIFGLVSDSFGRRTAIILDVCGELIFGLIITFCDSEGWFRLIVFLKSLFGSANFYMGLVLVCEIASNGWRSWLSFIVMFPRLFRMICMVPIANSAPNMETYSFIACIYSCICLVLLRWSPESPQWLLFNRKIVVAENIILKAADINGIKLCERFKIRPVNRRAYNSLDETTTCVGIISTYNIRVIILVATIFWILYYFLWSSLYVRMYSQENINYLLLKVFCSVAVLVCLTVFSSMKLTLRFLLLAHILITGVFAAGVIFIEKGTTYNMIYSIALASGLVAHALILNITPRLFAINIRATIFGCCHATGQLGSIISYLLFLFHPMTEVTYLTIELAVTLILAGLCFIFPDVDRRELPDVLSDMDYFSELSKPLRWVSQKTNSPSHEEVQIRVYSFGSAQRSLSYQSDSDNRLPAQRIGCIRLWRMIVSYIRQKITSRRVNPHTQ